MPLSNQAIGLKVLLLQLIESFHSMKGTRCIGTRDCVEQISEPENVQNL